jgi:hypothetical protein
MVRFMHLGPFGIFYLTSVPKISGRLNRCFLLPLALLDFMTQRENDLRQGGVIY